MPVYQKVSLFFLRLSIPLAIGTVLHLSRTRLRYLTLIGQFLLKYRFEDSKNHSKDHKYLELHYDEKMILYTKLSHCIKNDLDNYLIRQMSTQCKLFNGDFADLVNCPMSAEAFIEKLKDLGEIE